MRWPWRHPAACTRTSGDLAAPVGGSPAIAVGAPVDRVMQHESERDPVWTPPLEVAPAVRIEAVGRDAGLRLHALMPERIGAPAASH